MILNTCSPAQVRQPSVGLNVVPMQAFHSCGARSDEGFKHQGMHPDLGLMTGVTQRDGRVAEVVNWQAHYASRDDLRVSITSHDRPGQGLYSAKVADFVRTHVTRNCSPIFDTANNTFSALGKEL